jgi:hypothetical protein
VNRKPNPVIAIFIALALIFGVAITASPKTTSAATAPTGTEMTVTEDSTDATSTETTTEDPNLGIPEGEDPPALTCPNGSIEVDHSETWQEPEFCVIVADGKVTAWTADGHLDPDTYIKNVNTDETSPDLGPNRVSVSIACEQTVVLNDPNIQDGAVNILWKHTAPACPPPPARLPAPHDVTVCQNGSMITISVSFGQVDPIDDGTCVPTVPTMEPKPITGSLICTDLHVDAPEGFDTITQSSVLSDGTTVTGTPTLDEHGNTTIMVLDDTTITVVSGQLVKTFSANSADCVSEETTKKIPAML